MACTDFLTCVTNPIAGQTASTRYSTLSAITFYIVNFIFFILWAVFIIYIMYNLVMAVYKLMMGNDEETMKHVKDLFTKSVVAAIGLVVLVGARFILATALSLVGVPADQNPFD